MRLGSGTLEQHLQLGALQVTFSSQTFATTYCPPTGANGIPIRDEIELELALEP
jgi:hypothetical protein